MIWRLAKLTSYLLWSLTAAAAFWTNNGIGVDDISIELHSIELENNQPLDDEEEAAKFWEEYENSESTYLHHEVVVSRETERRLADACARNDPFKTYTANLYVVIGNAKGLLKTAAKKKKYGDIFKNTYNRHEKKAHNCIEIDKVDVVAELFEDSPAPTWESPVYADRNLRFSPRLYIKQSLNVRCRGCTSNEIVGLIMGDVGKVYYEHIETRDKKFKQQRLRPDRRPDARQLQEEGIPPIGIQLVLDLIAESDIAELACINYMDFFEVNPRCYREEFL